MRRIGIAACLALLALPVWGEPGDVRVRIADCQDLGVTCPDANAPRSLVVELRALKDSTLEMRRGEVDLPSYASLPLAIDVEGPHCDDTPLELRARNQHPDYWKHRSPPSIDLSVHRVDGNVRVAVPFRVTSSAAGSPLFANVLILETEPRRRVKLREHAEWFAAYSRERFAATRDTADAMNLDRYIEMLDLQYQYAPPGYYEVVARYTPPSDSTCHEALESEPLAVSVYEAGDSLAALRAEVRADGMR